MPMTATGEHPETPGDTVHMPAPTAWPMVLAAGLTLLAAGLITHWLLLLGGLVLSLVAACGWVGELRPGVGEMAEDRVPAEQRPRPIAPAAEPVESMVPGLPGYRMRLPEKMRPYSAGVKGGIVGGLVMPIPALLYGILSGNGIWYPINLLAGMVFLRYDNMSEEQLRQFSLLALVVGTVIHAIMSVGSGLVYAVVAPTLPGDRPIFWGGVVMPLVWSGICYGLMGAVNPLLADRVSWPWFIVSQYVYGLVAGYVVVRSEKVYTPKTVILRDRATRIGGRP